MREANWDDVFQRRREESAPASERLSATIPWEDWLTFAITTLVFMSVVASVDSADWVSGMPSMYPIGFSALVTGHVLSRVRRPELLVHAAALLVGATLLFAQILAIIPGQTPFARTDHLLDRMHAWWSAVTQNGISGDTLPLIVLMLVLTWLGAYISSWAIFRWRNAWLGLVPGGIALMWNISFIPGQFSYAFVVFVFGAVLLIMRLHVARKEQAWVRQGVRYPEFISLSTLNATFWVTLGLLLSVWLMPLASRSDTANQRWQDFTAPITRHFTPLARVFISVNAKKPINIHNLRDALPFQGKINLNTKDAVEVNVKISPEVAAFLREQSFDEYTSNGWKLNIQSDVPLPPGANTAAEAARAPGVTEGTRQDVTINVKVEGGNDQHLYSLGQPVNSDQNAVAPTGGDAADVASLQPAEHLSNGDTYSTTGSVSIASIGQLRAAGVDYPAWVTDRYLSLPNDLPSRVRQKAGEVAASAVTPYDRAAAVEKYLRTFPNDYNVPITPAGHDAVDYFLFDLQRGYFDYHASAMAVMLRSLGIPARVATGYVVDPLARQGDSDVFKLTERNAFAWPEVYFPGAGWVEFSPTPSQPLINRPGTPKAPASIAGSSERGLSEGDAIDLGIVPPGSTTPPISATKPSTGGGTDVWPVLMTLTIIGAVAIALAAGAKLAWEWGLGGLSRPAQLWEKTVRLAALGRSGPRRSETPREFAARLRRDVPGADAAGYLAATYERNRFGHKPLSDDETERLETAWTSLRTGLLRRVLRLKPRAG